uniref:Uncharacterized protein n=1 Tax=Rhizophora mucronata TaxID=61149 RepID=A0A2P2MYJ5_RHIMU
MTNERMIKLNLNENLWNNQIFTRSICFRVEYYTDSPKGYASKSKHGKKSLSEAF